MLDAGGYFSSPRDQGFRDTPSADLISLVGEIEQGRPWREAVRSRYASTKPWLYDIITHASRTSFVGPVLPVGDGAVLDIGSGWGQIARPIAAHRPVVALEPVAERLAFIRAAARQDGTAGRVAFVESDYFEIDFTTRFAAICVIGVLEWAGAFQDQADPQERQRQFLRKARRELAPGGSLILGIENRLGLKYLFGCADDHLGVPGIAALPAPLARQRWQETSGHTLQSFTYSLTELEHLLRDAGFSQIDFFGAFPDYKLPAAIVPLADSGRQLQAWLATNPLPPEHDGYTGKVLPADLQSSLSTHYAALAAARQAQHFVPSFFVRAG
jgi:SAM-dependent methyltransferase